jgi:hypothetical protein
MKLKFLAIGALLVLGWTSAFADGLRVGGYAIYTDYLAIQTTRTTNGVTDSAPVTVNAGPWWLLRNVGNRTQFNFSYDSDVVGFVTTFRVDEQMLSDTSSGLLTNLNPLNTANITFKLMDGQVKLRSGLYQEEGLGFDFNAYSTGIVGRYLASSHGGGTDSNYLTSVTYSPEDVPGLSVLVGVPIAPNSLVYPTKATVDADQADLATNVYKRFRIAAKWDIPDVGLVHAYWYNALYSNKTSATDAGFLINHAYEGMDEGLIGIENINFLDAQWKFGYVMDHARGASDWAFEHNFTVSSRWLPAPGLTILADGIVSLFNKEWATTATTYMDGAQTYYATSTEWADDKLGLINRVQVTTTFDVKPVQYGLLLGGVYEPTGNAHYYMWGQPSAALVNNDVGQGWELIGVANPYVKLAIGQGTVQLGVNLVYDAKSVGSVTNTAVGWQVPVDFFLWF